MIDLATVRARLGAVGLRAALVALGALAPLAVVELCLAASPTLRAEGDAARDAARAAWEMTTLPRDAPWGRAPLVAVLGESTGERLAEALAVEMRGRARVWSCATSAISPELLARRLDAVLDARPAAVVFVLGHNHRFVHDARPWAPWPWRLSLGGRAAPWLARRALGDPTPAQRTGDVARREADFAVLLARMVAEAQRRGARAVLTTMVSNHAFPAGEPPRDDDAARVARAVRLLHALGRDDDALALGDDLAPSRRAGVDFERALVSLHRADLAAARARLRDAVTFDAWGGRATEHVNDAIRGEARARGAALRDAAAAYGRGDPAGLPGWAADVDNCHLRPEHVRREARAVSALVARALSGERGARDDAAPEVLPVNLRARIADTLARLRESRWLAPEAARLQLRAAELSVAEEAARAGVAADAALRDGARSDGAEALPRGHVVGVMAVAAAESGRCQTASALSDEAERLAGDDGEVWERVTRATARCRGAAAGLDALARWRRAAPADAPGEDRVR